MNPYATFVAQHAALLREGQTAPLGGFPMPLRPTPAAAAPKALIFSPHPDDEVIFGGLPLRLGRELGWNVINVAVTLGSLKARQAARWAELQNCCRYIGFGLVKTCDNGLEGVNLKTRQQDAAAWGRSVERIQEILTAEQPRAIFFPHQADWNSTHVGTHHLVMDALARMDPGFAPRVVETEFWGAMDTPNLMIESGEQDIIDLITALSFHAGEVQRNPYHLRLPAWLIDNVRRGGELVGGQGGAAPAFAFATLYRLRRWETGRLAPVLERGRIVSCAESLAPLFG